MEMHVCRELHTYMCVCVLPQASTHSPPLITGWSRQGHQLESTVRQQQQDRGLEGGGEAGITGKLRRPADGGQPHLQRLQGQQRAQ